MQKGHLNHTVGEVICLAPSVLRAGQRKWTVGGGCYSLYILLLYSLAFSLEPFSTLLESGVSPSLCFQRINLWEDVNGGEGKLQVHIQTVCVCAQSCPTLCNPIDCNLPGFSVHGVLQTRILEWVAIPFSRESSWLRDGAWVSCIAGKFLSHQESL